ncbi:exodeoxyribonuclease III [Candidatus Campbellbacteria bacterium CG10_big_fil_rev_8_21_14_0_10_35_52]|uniref:Exodeoxyribonuclease III n=1 Tax=Candidatus Campbellbacteria bacterium CG10_big_fil_rev_8_21_14_0_10_35_52 TaxID=1974527 RepID=A0A2M6WVW6_9BACT|nr:MAG: exodeoxyribonuclease III [Candidatus Campbellbacteria bacterium CG10_big_fil_rev_8_21_14_0_10_35_52]
MTKILSWNVNGLRAVCKKELWNNFLKQDADIFCLQETKAHIDQLPENVRKIKGYFSYFASSETKKGYSGVATYSKIKPEKVRCGMGIKKLDQEGRLLSLYFKNFVLLNVYFPNGRQSPERFKYKLDFYDAFLDHIEKLKKDEHKIIFCGDVNTAHKEIDLARPKENKKNTGFLPIERAWIDKVIHSGYIDTFRYFHPDKKEAYSYWDIKTRARDRNVGWRLDYFFISQNLQKNLKDSFILKDIFGSDHAPVGIKFY